MPGFDIVTRRLQTQRLRGRPFASVPEAVAWFGAVQAQDLRGAMWGIGQRVGGATEADVARAVAERSIVRTWPMRGTLHFVARDDVRWMLALLAPRILIRSAGRYRELGLDTDTFARSKAHLEKALAGGKSATRTEAYRLLEEAGISTAGQRGIHVLGALAMQGALCMATPHGKQPAFALLDEWIGATAPLDREEAIAKVAARYFTGHGPATLRDFTWWSGLSPGDARRGLAMAESALREQVRDERAYWSAPLRSPPAKEHSSAHLLPAYDEFAVGYRDRDAILDPTDAHRAGNGIFSPIVLIDGRVAGTWRRTIAGARVRLDAEVFARPTPKARAALADAVAAYGAFLGKTAELTLRVG